MVLNERQYLDNLRSSGDVVFLGDPASPARISWAPVPDGNGFMAINDARPDEGAANLSLIGTISRSSFSLNSVWGFDIEHKRPWQMLKSDATNLAESRGIGVVSPPPAAFGEFRAAWLPSWDSLREVIDSSGAQAPHKGLHELGIPTSTKITHKGFTRLTVFPTEATPAPPNLSSDTADITDGNETTEPVQSVTHATEPEYDAPFTMAHWHLPANCEHLRASLITTHKPVPLNAVLFGSDDPILPVNYESSLRGALVEARFSLRYMVLRREEGPVSWFTATIEELIILELPAVLLPSPLQARSRSRFIKKDNDRKDKDSGAGGPGNSGGRSKRGAPGPAASISAKRSRT